MSSPAEWATVRQAVAGSYAADPAAWVAFARCRALALHTAGAAPAVPHAPGAWAVVVLGYPDAREAGRRRRARARLDLSGLLPPNAAGPAPDATRAATVAVLAALAVLEYLGHEGWKGSQATIWAAGEKADFPTRARRAVDRELWEVVGVESAALGWVVGGGVRLEPAAGAPAVPPPTAAELAAECARSAAPAPDYTLVLLGADDGAAPVGRYGILTRDGRQRTGDVPLSGLTHPDEGEYRTLIAALTELSERIARQRQTPGRYRLTVVSARAAVLDYLQARAAGPAAQRPPGVRTARDVLARFAAVTFIHRPAAEIAALLGPDARGTADEPEAGSGAASPV